MLFLSPVLYLPLEPILQAVLYYFCSVSSSTVAADVSGELHLELSAAKPNMSLTTSLHSASAHSDIFNESK